MTEGIPLEEAPYGEYLKILRKEGYINEAEEFEEEFTKIFHELGYSKEDLFATSLKSVQEIIDIYANEMQRQVSLAVSRAQGSQLGGNVLAGKDIDEDTIKRVATLQNMAHEEHKSRQMYK